MPCLENFRTNNFPGPYFILSTYPDLRIYKTYDRYATKAFQDTFRDISQLENSKAYGNHHSLQSQSSIAFWFLAMESYLATLIRISCIRLGITDEGYKKLSQTQQLLYLIQILDIHKKSFNETDIIGKVHEFCQFRNELYMERKTGEEMIFRKTAFSGLPFLCNQVDGFQAMLIVLELSLRLKQVFPGISTMPQITLSGGETTITEDLDKCYYNMLMPCFSFVLQKHDLTTELIIDLPEPAPTMSKGILDGDVQLLPQTDRQTVRQHPEITTYCLSAFNEFINMQEERSAFV